MVRIFWVIAFFLLCVSGGLSIGRIWLKSELQITSIFYGGESKIQIFVWKLLLTTAVIIICVDIDCFWSAQDHLLIFSSWRTWCFGWNISYQINVISFGMLHATVQQKLDGWLFLVYSAPCHHTLSSGYEEVCFNIRYQLFYLLLLWTHHFLAQIFSTLDLMSQNSQLPQLSHIWVFHYFFPLFEQTRNSVL